MPTMKLTVTQETLSRSKADAWVVFMLGKTPLAPGDGPAGRKLRDMIRSWIKATAYAGEPGQVASFPSWDALPARFVLLAGLGPKKDFHPGRLQRAAAAAARRACKLGLSRLATSVAGGPRELGLSPDDVVRAVVMGVQAGRYEFRRFLSERRRAGSRSAGLALCACGTGAGRLRRTAGDALRAAEIFSEVRDLANLPANEAPPALIARESRRLAQKYGVSCRILGPKELRREKCGALLAVARGSRQAPRMIILKHRGTAPGLRPAVIVGKTITFDAGGISLKPPKSMEWMKYDKCGGMAVLAAVLAAARLKVRRPVVAILAVAENMPDGNATRPGDIVRARSGKTIEIINTDAEGRLALADALSMAADIEAEAIVDLATLTGACVVALGHALSAVMGDRRLVEQLRKAGERSGDRLWPLPLLPDYAEGLKGRFADLLNVTTDHAAGALVGGAFLRHFVPERTPWAHIDIAGTAWTEKDQPHAPAGATLFGAALLLQWIQDLEGRR